MNEDDSAINERRDIDGFAETSPIVSSLFSNDDLITDDMLDPIGDDDDLDDYHIDSEEVGPKSSNIWRFLKVSCLGCGIFIEVLAIGEYFSWGIVGVVFGSLKYETVPKCHVTLIKVLTILVGISFLIMLVFEVFLMFSECFKLCATLVFRSKNDESISSLQKNTQSKAMKTLNCLNLLFLSGFIIFVLFALVFSVIAYVYLWGGECDHIWGMYFYDIYLIASVIELLCILIITPCLCFCCVCSDDV